MPAPLAGVAVAAIAFLLFAVWTRRAGPTTTRPASGSGRPSAVLADGVTIGVGALLHSAPAGDRWRWRRPPPP